MTKKIVKLLLIIIWMGIIFSFSNDSGSSSDKKSDSVIITIYKIFDKRELSTKQKEEIIKRFVFPIRKLAHFSEYFILGILLLSFLSEFMLINTKSILLSITLTMLYAVSDEVHQLFSAGRSARVFDVLVDTLGGSTGIIIYSYIVNKLSR